MNRTPHYLLAVGCLLACASLALATESATLTFSGPTDNATDTAVQVTFDPGVDTDPIMIPPRCSATRKRNLIAAGLRAKNYTVTTDGLPDNQLKIEHLRNGTKVDFQVGATGEIRDDVVGQNVRESSVKFIDRFEPFDVRRQPAVFTAGIVTDVGELTAQVSAQELNFQTDGPIICQALFQRLAPRAPRYGAQINYAGDRLDIYFDPAYTLTQGGVIFGTSSLSPGCSGATRMRGNPCPPDLDGDGVVGQGDLGILLAAYGCRSGDGCYNPLADLDEDGVVGQGDLGVLLAAYGQPCR